MQSFGVKVEMDTRAHAEPEVVEDKPVSEVIHVIGILLGVFYCALEAAS